MADESEQRVTLVSPDGRIFNFPRSEALGAIHDGFRFQTGDEVKEKAFGDVFGAHPVTAGVAGALSSLTLGGSDLAYREAGLGSGVRQLEEANPTATTVGKVAGYALPLAGELSAGAKIAGGALGGISAGGQAIRGAAAAAGAKLGTSGLAKAIVERYVPAALGYGAEGAVYGAGQSLSEQALGDHDLSAEKILAGAGMGAAAGGAIGGGLPALGDLAGQTFGLLGKGTRKLAQSIGGLWEQQTGKPAAEGLGRAYARLIGKGEDADTIAELMSNHEARKMAVEGASNTLREQATGDIVEAMNKANDIARPIKEDAVGPLKEEVVKHLVPDGMVADAAEQSLKKIEEIEKQVADMRAQPGLYGRGAELKKYASILAAKKDAVLAAGVAGDGGRVFSEMDQLKRLTGPLAKFDTAASMQTIEGATTNELKGMYDGLQAHLEDADLWGDKAAELQKAVNARWHAFLSPEAYRNNFMVKTATDRHGPIFEANPAAIRGLIDKLGTQSSTLDYRYFGQRAQLQQELIQEVADKYQLSPAVRENVAQAAEHVENLQSTLSNVEKRVTLANQLRELSGGESAKEQGLFGRMLSGGMNAPTMIGGALGFMGGGPVGAAAGAALGSAVANPGFVIRQIAALDHIAKGVDGEAVNKIGQLLSGGAEALAPAYGRAVGPAAGALSRSFLTGRSDDGEPRDNFHRRIQELSELANNPAAMTAHETERNQEWAKAAPNVAQALQLKRMAAVNFLLSKAPKDPTAGMSINPLAHSWQPSGADLATWQRYVRAVQSPMSVVHDLASGHVTPEAVEALQAVYPKLYQQISVGIATKLAQETRQISYRNRLNLGTFLRAPTDPSMTPDFARAMAQASQPTKEDQREMPHIGGDANLAKGYATSSQELGEGA